MEFAQARELFIAEAREYIQTMNDGLLKLEQNPENQTLLDEVFRAAHSLKGMSATMGYESIVALTHEMENVFDRLRNGTLVLNSAIVDVMLEGTDKLEQAVMSLSESDDGATGFSEDKYGDLIQRLRECSGNSEVEYRQVQPGQRSIPSGGNRITLDEFETEVARQAVERGSSIYEIHIVLRENCLLKSVRVFTVFKTLEEMGDILKSNPPAQDLDEEKFDREFGVIVISQKSGDELRAAIEGISEIDSVDVARMDPANLGASQAQARARAQAQGSLVGTGKPEVKAESKPGNKGEAGASGSSEKIVRVETERLDKLINLVGELVINRTRVVQTGKDSGNAEHQSAIEQLDRLTTDLQNAVMKLRMVPIKQVFDRFPRMIRDLARSEGKSVQLVMNGAETELDRSVVNQIGDPLVHLIRNSIDHGIEPPEIRRQKGKPEMGTIRLEARHEGNHVVVEIEDDGAGIDSAKIRAKAAEKGIVNRDEAMKMSDRDALKLIFSPGFSTAERVSDVSGRGVGMDVVRSAIEGLGGSVDVSTKVGAGTRFTLQLPLTLAIIKALLVAVGDETYAVPVQSIRENLRISGDKTKTVHGHPVITNRGEVLPLIFLGEVLETPGYSRPEMGPNRTIPVMVVSFGDRRGALVVDRILGQQEVVIKSLNGLTWNTRDIAGATILGDGKVALILDVAAMI